MCLNTSMSIRIPAVKNQFYPGNENILKSDIFRYFEEARVGDLDGQVKAIIAPHASYIYSGYTAAYPYKILKKLDQQQEKDWKVVLIGPSHHLPFAGAAVSTYDNWQTPLGLVKTGDLRDVISSNNEDIIELEDAHASEHSLEVQLPFLQISLKNFTIYPLVLGSVRSDSLADDLLDFVMRDDVILVISSDLSHFQNDEDAKNTDLATSEAICKLDISAMAEIGDACGRHGILTAMFLAKKLNWKVKMLNYANSGDTAGGKDRVVGYGSYVFYK